MASTIQIKNSNTAGNSPSSLTQGELAINVADGNLFYGDGSSVKQDFAVTNITASAISASDTIIANELTASGLNYPSVDGTDGQVIITDGAGNLSFSGVSADDAEAIHIPVKNTSGVTITKGTPVYITGNVGGSERLEIAAADASDSAKMPAVGLLESDLDNNDEGFVAQGGYLRGLDTDPIDGVSTDSNDTIYVKVGGGLTVTKPTGSALIQNIAKVARSHGSAGSVIVSSILRTNDVPNITSGYAWVGNSDQVATAVATSSFVVDNANTASYVAVGNIDGTIDISDQTNLAGGTNLTLSGDTMNLDTDISLTNITASVISASGDVIGGRLNAVGDISASAGHFLGVHGDGGQGGSTYLKTSGDAYGGTLKLEFGDLDGNGSEIKLVVNDEDGLIDITGDVDTTGDISAEGDVNASNLDLTGNIKGDGTTRIQLGATSTITGNVKINGNVGTAPTFVLRSTDSSVASGDTISTISFGDNDVSSDDVASIKAIATENHSDDPEAGTKIEFSAESKQDAGRVTMLTLDPDDGATLAGDLAINGIANVSASIATIPTNNNQLTNGAGYTTNTGTVDTSGTPANNQLAIFTDSNTIEGDSDLTWDGSTLTITGQNKIPNTDASDQYYGDVVAFGGGGTLTQGSIYYLNSSQNWALADASAASTAQGMLGIATDTGIRLLVKGIARHGGWAGLGHGSVLYLSETAGELTTTKPTTSGAIVRVIGYCTNTTTREIYFNPSTDWIELA